MKCAEAALFRSPCAISEASNIIKIIMDRVGFIEQLISELFIVWSSLFLIAETQVCSSSAPP